MTTPATKGTLYAELRDMLRSPSAQPIRPSRESQKTQKSRRNGVGALLRYGRRRRFEKLGPRSALRQARANVLLSQLRESATYAGTLSLHLGTLYFLMKRILSSEQVNAALEDLTAAAKVRLDGTSAGVLVTYVEVGHVCHNPALEPAAVRP